MGYKNVSLDRAQKLKDHGVGPEFVHQIKQLGFADLDLSKAVELHDHDVTIANRGVSINSSIAFSLTDSLDIIDTLMQQYCSTVIHQETRILSWESNKNSLLDL